MNTKLFLSLLVAQIWVSVSFAQEYKPVDEGSAVAFEIKNLGFNTKGSFKGLDGRIVFDPNDLSKSSFDVTVDAATVNTDNEMRDNHLRKESYFDVENYPKIRFISTSCSGPDKNGHYTLSGKLTIKKTTKEMNVSFLATRLRDDYIFKGDFQINRKDYEVGGSSTIANNLNVSVTVRAKKA